MPHVLLENIVVTPTYKRNIKNRTRKRFDTSTTSPPLTEEPSNYTRQQPKPPNRTQKPFLTHGHHCVKARQTFTLCKWPKKHPTNQNVVRRSAPPVLDTINGPREMKKPCPPAVDIGKAPLDNRPPPNRYTTKIVTPLTGAPPTLSPPGLR